MNKIILEKLIYRNYLKTALTSILFIEVILVFIYFNASNSMVDKSVNFIIEDIKKNIHERVNEITSNMEYKFKNIESLISILQNEHQNFFKYQENINLDNPPKFEYAKNGMYYKTENNGGSSVFISKKTKITESVKNKLIKSEVFDNTFKEIVDKNDMIVAAYFNSHDDMNRYYPFLNNVFEIIPSDIKMEGYNFYYEADLKHNPEKKVVWTDVYLDPAGKGWVLSAITPIYNNNFLEGVTGLDITVNSLINNFLNFKLPYDGSSFLIDEKGNIIAMTKEIKNIFDMKTDERYKFTKDEKIKKTILKYDNIKSFEYKSKDIIDIFDKVVKNKFYSTNLKVNKDEYLFFSYKFEKTNWYIISLIDEKKVTSKVRKLEDHYREIGYLIIAFILLFYFIFFIYLYKKAKEFVQVLNEPLLKIIDLTKNLGTKKDIEELEECGIKEIDILSDNFNKLAKDLDERTRKLVKAEENKKHHEKLANTDSLTKVYNRRFLNDFTNRYMKIIKREGKTLSLLILDIDDFKNINDSYGHDTGDIILKNLVKRIVSIIRENDLIVRLGGDEFVVLLPNTNLIDAKKVAKKLIHTINRTNQMEKTMLTFTVSIGVSEYRSSDTKIEEIIKRADKALYEAKKNGKKQLC